MNYLRLTVSVVQGWMQGASGYTAFRPSIAIRGSGTSYDRDGGG